MSPTMRNVLDQVKEFLTMKNRLPLVASACLVATSALLAAPLNAQAADNYSISAYITGYSYWDNTPPGSADISHSVIHSKAGGVGTFNDPVTVAVGHSIVGRQDILDWDAGTKFYIPNLQRYFIVEDTCGDGGAPQNGACHTGYPSSTSTWLDVYVDGKSTSSSKSDACMGKITGASKVIVDPASDYKVSAGPISDGTCAEYGDTVVKTSTPTPKPSPSPTTPATTATTKPAPTPTATPRPSYRRTNTWRSWSWR